MASLDRMVCIEDLFSRSQACGEAIFPRSGHPVIEEPLRRLHTESTQGNVAHLVSKTSVRSHRMQKHPPIPCPYAGFPPFPALQLPTLGDHGVLAASQRERSRD